MPKADTRDGSRYCEVLKINGNYIQQEDFILEIIQFYYKIFKYNIYIIYKQEWSNHQKSFRKYSIYATYVFYIAYFYAARWNCKSS